MMNAKSYRLLENYSKEYCKAKLRHDRRSNLDKEANEAEKQPKELVKFTESQEISLEATPNTVVLRKIKTEMK